MSDGHHESGSAISALRAAPVAIGFLNGCQAAVFADSFNRRDLLPLAARGKYRAREHRSAVDEHGTGAARGVIASALGSSQPKILTKCVEQQFAGLDCQLAGAAINAEFDKLLFH